MPRLTLEGKAQLGWACQPREAFCSHGREAEASLFKHRSVPSLAESDAPPPARRRPQHAKSPK